MSKRKLVYWDKFFFVFTLKVPKGINKGKWCTIENCTSEMIVLMVTDWWALFPVDPFEERKTTKQHINISLHILNLYTIYQG